MATKKGSKGSSLPKPTVDSVVEDVLKRRSQALRARIKTLGALPTPAAITLEAAPVISKPTPHALLATAAKAGTRGWLIAEGDSWFDYPGTDILNALQQAAFDVESVANAGDRVEMMAFGRGQLDKFVAAIEKVIGNGHAPKAILLSGGGNDIAGTEFGFLINHAGSPKQGLNESIIRGVIDERIRDAYVWIIRTITILSQKVVGRKVRIVVHGYGYPLPDGDGVLGGWGPLPGPWLRPGFIEKGYNNLAANAATMAMLIDRFNNMLKGLTVEFDHIRYVDLRSLLPATKKLWANELHPKEAGFKLAAAEFAKAIEAP